MMLYQWIRILKNKNGTLTDFSLDNQDNTKTMLMNIDTSTDYIYIAQQFPFNNFYVKMSGGVVNDVASVMSIDYWTGTEWKATVDVIDATTVNGVSLAKSGIVQFSPNKFYTWDYVDDTSQAPSPSELRTKTIYNLYWIRIKFSASLKATTAIKRIGYCFSSTQQINSRDRTIASYYPAFGATKTDWEDEIMIASVDVINDLKARQLVINEGQILRFEVVTTATDWRTLKNIYRELGGDYQTKLEDADKEYKDAMANKYFTFGLKGDAAQVTRVNINSFQNYMGR